MTLSDYAFELPDELIAQTPTARRDASRLLVRTADAAGPPTIEHRVVTALPELLRPGDLLVVNDTRVLAARFLGERATGGRVELLFLEPAGGPEPSPRDAWHVLAKPAKKLRPGERLASVSGVEAEMLTRNPVTGDWTARLVPGPGRPDLAGRSTEVLLATAGVMPLPPYIDRAAEPADAERYQTVFATHPGAVAAPTAGLHFTDALLAALRARGVGLARVTLHVGAGTFLPVKADTIEEHRMHSERFALSGETAQAVATCRGVGGRVVAVGTTSARVLETCAVAGGAADDRSGGALVEARSGSTDIFLRPGHGPRVCDGLFTNFHLPKSTLLMLVASMIGREETLALYRTAVEERYRFYSYGDAMLLIRA